MDAVVFNSTALDNVGSPSVAIDTGTTLIGGPPDVIASIYALIPGAQEATGAYSGYWIYPCAENFTLGLQFGGVVRLPCSAGRDPLLNSAARTGVQHDARRFQFGHVPGGDRFHACDVFGRLL